jgi:oligopeptide transport system permease protein
MTRIFLYNDWGISRDGFPVWESVGERLPLSLSIYGIAFLIYVFGGIGLGLLCALYEGSIFDWIVTIFVSILTSIPIQVMTMFLIGIFAWVWRIATVIYLPNNGMSFSNLFIPIVAISMIPLATIVRLFRSEMIEAKQHEYIQLARTKGMSTKRALLKHSFRSCILPVVNELPNLFIYSLSASFIVELIYHVPGVSVLMFQILISLSPVGTWYVSINTESAMVVILYYVLLSFSFSLLVDILMPLIDPRIRIFETKQ